MGCIIDLLLLPFNILTIPIIWITNLSEYILKIIYILFRITCYPFELIIVAFLELLGIKKNEEKMNGWDFEHACARVLKAKGFYNVNVTPGSGDHGADIIAYKSGIKYVIQCKMYSNPVDKKAVEEVLNAKSYYHCYNAIVMTNNVFTKGAIKIAEKNHVKLWSNIHVSELSKDNNVDSDESLKQKTFSQKISYNFLNSSFKSKLVLILFSISCILLAIGEIDHIIIRHQENLDKNIEQTCTEEQKTSYENFKLNNPSEKFIIKKLKNVDGIQKIKAATEDNVSGF